MDTRRETHTDNGPVQQHLWSNEATSSSSSFLSSSIIYVSWCNWEGIIRIVDGGEAQAHSKVNLGREMLFISHSLALAWSLSQLKIECFVISFLLLLPWKRCRKKASVYIYKISPDSCPRPWGWWWWFKVSQQSRVASERGRLRQTLVFRQPSILFGSQIHCCAWCGVVLMEVNSHSFNPSFEFCETVNFEEKKGRTFSRWANLRRKKKRRNFFIKI